MKQSIYETKQAMVIENGKDIADKCKQLKKRRLQSSHQANYIQVAKPLPRGHIEYPGNSSPHSRFLKFDNI